MKWQGKVVAELVFPTGVGVNRVRPRRAATRWRIPHRRGGEPNAALSTIFGTEYSPQAWG